MAKYAPPGGGQAAALRRQGTVALIMLDLDGFKQINDTLGHPTGDAVLCEVARLLQENIRAEDIASRYGGDEFVLILPDVWKEIARERAESLCLATGLLNIQFEQQTLGPLVFRPGWLPFLRTA